MTYRSRTNKNTYMKDEMTDKTTLTDCKEYINFHHEEIERIFTTTSYIADLMEIERIKRLPRLTAIEDLENTIRYTLHSDKSPTELKVNRNCVDISLMLLYHFRSHESTELLIEYLKKDVQYIFNWQHARSLEHILPIFTYCSIFHSKKFITLSTESNICYWNRIIIPIAFNRISAIFPELHNKSMDILKEFMMKYYLKRNDSKVFDCRVVGTIIDEFVKTGSTELLPDIEIFFEDNLVDKTYCGSIEKIRIDIKNGKIRHYMVPHQNITTTIVNYFIELFFLDSRYENEFEEQSDTKEVTFSQLKKKHKDKIHELVTKLFIYNASNRKVKCENAM